MDKNPDRNMDNEFTDNLNKEAGITEGTDLTPEEGRKARKGSHCSEEGCSLCGDGGNRTTARELKLKTNLISRLNRVEGQVRGIKGMIDKDIYCDDVLNQIAAAQAALNSISKLVLENHIRGCLVKKIRAGEDEIVDELLVTISKLMK